MAGSQAINCEFAWPITGRVIHKDRGRRERSLSTAEADELSHRYRDHLFGCLVVIWIICSVVLVHRYLDHLLNCLSISKITCSVLSCLSIIQIIYSAVSQLSVSYTQLSLHYLDHLLSCLFIIWIICQFVSSLSGSPAELSLNYLDQIRA